MRFPFIHVLLALPLPSVAGTALIAQVGGIVGGGSDAGWSNSFGVIAVVAGGSILLQLITAGTALFITRREVESRDLETRRRLDRLEADTPVGFKEATSRVDNLRAQVTHEIADLHEKMNRIDRSLSAVESETRLQTTTLREIARAVRVTPGS